MRHEVFGLAKRAAVAGLMAAVMLAATGCLLLAGAAGGGAAAVYYEGNLQQTLSADLDTCHVAAERALADLKLRATKNRADAVTAHLESEYADGKHVWVNMEAVGKATQVTVRVGLLGDKERSLAILDGIKRHAGL